MAVLLVQLSCTSSTLIIIIQTLKKEKTMSALKGILENPMVKSLLLKQLKKAWKDHKIQLITITEKDGDLSFEVYTEPMTVITRKEFTNIITSNNE